jgi:hypothetical protein
MSYELSVVFKGLCGLVPDRLARQLHVLLVDTRNGATASDRHTKILPHLPCIQYRPCDGWELDMSPHQQFQGASGQDNALIILDRTQIEMNAHFSGPGLAVTARGRADGQDLNLLRLQDVSHAPNSADIHPACLAPVPSPVVVGRLPLTGGTLAPYVFPNGRASGWQFFPLDQTPLADTRTMKNVAPASVWRVPVEGRLKLTGIDFDDPGRRRWTLSREASSNVQIGVYNLERDAIVAHSRGLITNEYSKDPDFDFERLYELSKIKPGLLPVPHPLPLDHQVSLLRVRETSAVGSGGRTVDPGWHSTPSGVGGGRCMHALFNDVFSLPDITHG